MKTKVIKNTPKKVKEKYPCLMIGTETGSIYLFKDMDTCTLLHTPLKRDNGDVGREFVKQAGS